jgi:hypothetical protein
VHHEKCPYAIVRRETEQNKKTPITTQKDDEKTAQAPSVSTGAGMILLRCLSILAGCLVMMSPTLFMSGGSSGPAFFDGRTVFGIITGLALVSAAFFFVGFAGRKMRKSARLRGIAGALLAVPFLAGMAVLWRGGGEATLWASAALCIFTTVLFIAFVFPAQHARKHRPMRRRESLAS